MTATLSTDYATFAVSDTARATREGRPIFEWTIGIGGASWSGDDLCGPAVGAEPSEEAMLTTLLNFLSAALESWPDGENSDLFPTDVLDQLHPHRHDLECEAWERERDAEAE